MELTRDNKDFDVVCSSSTLEMSDVECSWYNYIKDIERHIGGTFIPPGLIQKPNGEVVNLTELVLKIMSIVEPNIEESNLTESDLLSKDKATAADVGLFKFLNGFDTKERRTVVLAGFPGVGKSTFFQNNKGRRISDSDSSMFSWMANEKGERVRDPEFPGNYMEHIQELVDGGYEIIFVSTHKDVLQALKTLQGINLYIVYPSRELRGEYLFRYLHRGSPESFIKLMDDNWDSFIDDIESNEDIPKIKLVEEYQTISDAISDLKF